MKLKYFILGLLAFSIFSCQNLNESLIYGKWGGDELFAKGESSAAQNAEFQFYKNGRFSYKNAYYKEAGTFIVVGDKLMTTDTTKGMLIEKLVEVKLLTTDSLHIKMITEKTPQILKLVKRK